ncbi:glycosyltransferase [Variovorax sp. YR752]|uniref:glycosyltransferase n=1 Tax=Variovorax sp. YR752 TaxID=1884383 RepID=UPI0031377D49
MPHTKPALIVLSTLFPSAAEPVAGVFIKERMFRVARQLPITVVAPQPWFPLQGLLRRWKPSYRPDRPRHEVVDGIEIHRPRYLALPGVLRRLDGWSIAMAVRPLLRRLRDSGRADLLDVHFGYPDGYAGHLLARWCGLPYLITLRGKEERLRHDRPIGIRMARALRGADRVVAVSQALRQVGIELGADERDAVLIGNGIDLEKFNPIAQEDARARLEIPHDARVLVSVGSLVERKGFHRIIECLPALVQQYPQLLLLVVGGVGPEGDYSAQLRALTERLAMGRHVRFLGAMAPADLHVPLSAADLFVLATRYEGWANVLLEAMACRLPVITTRVGGNAEVVCRPELGVLVPFGDTQALREAIGDGLMRSWDRDAIQRYAAENTWDRRIEQLLALLREMHEHGPHGGRPRAQLS